MKDIGASRNTRSIFSEIFNRNKSLGIFTLHLKKKKVLHRGALFALKVKEKKILLGE